jgi:multicomponent Na+:H+ antiporter subunit C
MTTVQAFGLLNYWVVVFLMMLGFYIVIARQNFIKTIIGLNIFQISVILMYITMGKVAGGTAPIVKPEIAKQFAQHGQEHQNESKNHFPGREQDVPREHNESDQYSNSPFKAVSLTTRSGDGFSQDQPFVDPTIYSNPLPSVLMLTAIVVGVGTTAVALALVVRIREDYGTIEEDEVLERDRIA